MSLAVRISNDSILMGNYFEVAFTIENASIKKFEAPDFEGFNIISGPNQSSSMVMNNGTVAQSLTYSYYLEPLDIGNYYIQPAFVDTGEDIIESAPLEVIVLDNPDGIIQGPQQRNRKDLFNSEIFFGGADFFGDFDIFQDFFEQRKSPFSQPIPKEQPKSKSKKKRKVYKL